MAYNVSEAFREQCYSGESLYSCRLIIGENTIPISQIASITISSPIVDSDSETFYIGTFISQKLTIKFKNLDGIETASGTNVELYISQNVSGTDIEVPIGKYLIDESPENYYQSATIECLDYAIKFATNLDYSSALVDEKIKTDDLLQWICTHYGVTLGSYPDTNGDVEIGTYDSTVSGKRWISYIAEIKGCNAKMDREGQLTLVPLKSSPVVTIDALKSKSWELGEKYEISGVTFFDAIRNYSYGDDTKNTLIIRQDNPFIVNKEVVKNIFEKVSLNSSSVEQNNNFKIDNTVNGIPIEDFKMYGDTQQDSTPTPSSPQPIHNVSGDNTIEICGKNLWGGFTSYTSSNNGVDFTQNENGSVYANGTASNAASITIANLKANNIYKKLQAGTYTMSKDSNLVQLQAYNVDTTTLIATALTTETSKTFTISEEQNIAIRIAVPKNTTIDNTINIQLEKGSTSSEYEAYTGNSQLISLGVENLFDKDNVLEGYELKGSTGDVLANASWYVSDYIKVEPNTRYYLSGNRTSGGSICRYDKDKQYISFQGGTITGVIDTDTAEYIRFNGLLSELNNNVMIEKGSKANSFSPYGTTPIELCKISTYQDYIYKSSDKWYLHKEIGKVVLDGSESWAYTSPNNKGIHYTTITNKIQVKVGLISNYYKYGGINFVWQTIQNNEMAEENNSVIFIRNDNITSKDDFKTWLSTHNTIVYYVLATPTDTEITNEELLGQLNSIKENAQFYSGTTNISSTAPITFKSLTYAPFICYSIKNENYGDISLDAWDNITYTLGDDSYNTLNNNTITYEMTIMSKVDTKIPTKQQEITTNVVEGTEEQRLRTLKTEVNGIEGTITLQAEQISENTANISSLQIAEAEISAEVSNTQTIVNNNYQEITSKFNDYALQNDYVTLENSVRQIQSDTYTKTEINTKLTDGSVTKVMTTSGTFDENGMHYEKTNAPTKTTINEKGVEVDSSSSDSELLFAGYDENTNQTIVRTDNMTVRRYCVIGDNSRLEDYGNGGGIFIL